MTIPSLPLRAVPLAEHPFGLGVTDGAGFRALRQAAADDAAAVAGVWLEQAAAGDDPARREFLLWSAHALAPSHLPVYHALYKFLFQQKRLVDAERVAMMALGESARQGGFPVRWTELRYWSADWSTGPGRFYLFSLKALAFICLRLHGLKSAGPLLEKLHELDPKDRVGGSVIADLAEAVRRNDLN